MAALLRDGEEGAPTTQPRPRPAVVGSIVIGLLALATVGLWLEVNSVENDIGDLQQELAGSTRAIEGLQAQTERVELENFDAAAVADGARPSVYAVEAPAGNQVFVGTAFAMSTRGRRSLLVTNYHVVEGRWLSGARDVRLTRGLRKYQGTIVETKPEEDLALIETDVEIPPLRPASTPPQVGDPIVVIGSAEGLEGTITTGVVSAIDRVVEGLKWLQFSAPVNPGNSGGPVIDTRGEVLGVATFKAVGVEIEGLSFAIPVQRLCTSLDVCEL